MHGAGPLRAVVEDRRVGRVEVHHPRDDVADDREHDERVEVDGGVVDEVVEGPAVHALEDEDRVVELRDHAVDLGRGGLGWLVGWGEERGQGQRGDEGGGQTGGSCALR